KQTGPAHFAPARKVSFLGYLFVLLKREPSAELAHKCTWCKRAGWVDKAFGRQEGSCSVCVVEIASVVGFVRQIKSLEHKLKIPTFPDTNILRHPHVHVEECVAALRIITNLTALPRSQ